MRTDAIVNLVRAWASAPALFLILLSLGCGGGGGGSNDTPPGTLRVAITDGETGTAVAGATVLLLNGATGDPIADVLTTDANGLVGVDIQPASVLVLVAAQDYQSVPPTNQTPLAVQVQSARVTDATVDIFPAANGGTTGLLRGVTQGASGQPVGGALVVAEVNGAFVSTRTGRNGGFVLPNVPSGTARLTAWKAGVNFDALEPIAVDVGQETGDLALTVIGNATGSASGMISFLAVTNGIVDITVTHPDTGDVIPGLRTFNNTNNDFHLTGIPDGTFHVLASLEDDDYVIDPDRIVKFGMPTITIAGGPIAVDFDVTDSVPLVVPMNDSEVALPVQDTDLVFQWQEYPSTSDYVVEVVDASGRVVWGGFAPDGTKKMMTTQTSIAFNDDGQALESLQPGRFYQVRIYASKDDQKEALGYKLISSTETLDGVFRVLPDPQ